MSKKGVMSKDHIKRCKVIIDYLPHREKLVQRTAVHYLCRDHSKVETLGLIYIPHIVLMSVGE